jgi:hypothetical protein
VNGDKEFVDGQCLVPIGNWCEKRKKVLGRASQGGGPRRKKGSCWGVITKTPTKATTKRTTKQDVLSGTTDVRVAL